MSSIGLNHVTPAPLKFAACKFCIAAKTVRASQDTQICFHDLEKWNDHVPKEFIDLMASRVTPKNWDKHEYDGIPVGRLAAVDLLMHYKINSFEIPESYWQAYMQQLVMCYETLFAMRAVIDELSPDRVLVYNTLFGLNHVVKIVSEQLGSPCYSIHLGFQSRPDSNAVMLYRDDDSQIRIAHTEEAKSAIQRPCSRAGIQEAAQFYRVTLRASSHTVYSSKYIRQSPRLTREMLGVCEENPVILVPLASADERFALSLLGLSSLRDGTDTAQLQTDWLQNILDIAQIKPEWQFVIRPHPRMFPNHRDRHLASEAQRLLDMLSKRPNNVRLNLPGDHLSLANILQISDVVLGSTSSAGVEALAYGLPVVTHNASRLFAFPAEIGLLVKSPDEYVSAIEAAISSGWSIEYVRNAIRWMNFLNRQVAREVYCSEAESAEVNVVARFSSSAVKFVRERRLFHRLPKWLSVLASGVHTVGQVKRGTRDLIPHPEAPIIDQVLKETLAGLHEVDLEMPRLESDECNDLKLMLTEVLELLGQYKDERCLSSKIHDHLSS